MGLLAVPVSLLLNSSSLLPLSLSPLPETVFPPINMADYIGNLLGNQR